MTLEAGTRLGPYEVLGPLGAGVMGEVYRARDTRLGRDVAIKVLPADRLADEAQRARFVREARAASALNHPHIVTIYEIEEAEGIDFIVMELVPGKTLDALIPGQGMRSSEALRIAIPLADAVAAAHAAGIVHRDLKPANVMVTPDGVVKVLDFGIAKLTREDATTLDVQARLSRSGAAAGTPAYMSPEQASGGAIDARTDVFSFGAMLYEMVTGRKPFRGGSIAETFAALLKEEPDPPTELAPDVPEELERIILRCLRKERERRFQHMGDVKVELQEVKQESVSKASARAGAASARRRSRRRWIALVAAGCLVLAAAGAVTVSHLRRGKLPEPRVVLLAPSRSTIGGTFSPDGTQIAFGSPGERGDNVDIWLKIVGEAETRRLTSAPGLDVYPAWSPDGKQIAFVRQGQGASSSGVYLVSPLGGQPRRLSEFPARLQLSWSPDGRWLAAGKVGMEGDEARGIHLIPAGGGEPRAATFPGPHAFDVFPAFSPDGHALAYASCAGERVWVCDLYVLSLDSESRPRGVARVLTRQRFWSEGLAWARDGRSIVYGDGSSYLWRVHADGSSPPERVELAGRGASYPFTVSSRDRLGFVRGLDDVDIYRFQAGMAAATPLLASTAWDCLPQYSPDGLRIAFGSSREGVTLEIWLADADGSNPTRLTRGPGRAQGSPRWSSDGRLIAFDSQGEDGRYDVWTIGVDGSGLHRVTHDPSNENVPSFSRDGRWVYFGSDRTGRYEVWRVAASGGAEEQVTRDGGYLPFESIDGRTLYYTRAPGQAPVLARPTAGGEERTIIGCAPASFGYAVGPEGVFHLDCQIPADPSQRILRRWDAGTGKDRPLATLDTGAWAALGLSVSPDGRSILYTRATWSQDLMTIENFR